MTIIAKDRDRHDDYSPLLEYTPEQWVRCANQRINQALTIRSASAASTRTQDEIVRAWSHVRAIQERRLGG